MFQSHKSFFFFFFHCKRKEKNNSLSHTHIFCNKDWISPGLVLFIGIVLALSSPCGLYLTECNANTSDCCVRHRKHPQEIHCTLHLSRFCSLLHLLQSHCIYLIHEDIQQISNLYLQVFFFSSFPTVLHSMFTFFKLTVVVVNTNSL